MVNNINSSEFAKGGLLQCERPPFGGRLVSFCVAKGYLLQNGQLGVEDGFYLFGQCFGCFGGQTGLYKGDVYQ